MGGIFDGLMNMVSLVTIGFIFIGIVMILDDAKNYYLYWRRNK